MKNKAESETALGAGRLVLVLFFTVFIINGFYHAGILLKDGDGTVQNDGSAAVLSVSGHFSDNVISEQRSGISVFSAFRKHNSALWDSKIHIESFWAVLFKIAFIPCVNFLLWHFARNVNLFLQRINCGFIHRQDGKKKASFSFDFII